MTTEQKHPTFDDLEILAEVSQLLTVVDIDSVISKVIELVNRATGAKRTSLFLLEGSAVDWEHIITMRNLSGDASVKVVSRVLDEGFAGWVVRNQQGDIIEDTATDERWVVFPDDDTISRSVLCVPFINDGLVIGIVTLVHDEPHHFEYYHLRLMNIIANQVSIAINNAQLFNRVNNQRRQLSAVLRSMRDVLLVLDPKGIIQIANPSALVLLGAQHHDDVIGTSITHYMEVDDVFEPISQILNNGLMENDHWSFETRSDNQQTDYQVRMAVWQSNQQQHLGFVIVMHDVTELRDLHRFKDEMLRVATHDLRSPLALISGYNAMIAMDTPDESSPVHEHVEIIKGVVERMGNLVDDLLRIEQIRTTPLELQEMVNLQALTKLIIVNMRPLAHAKALNFDSELDLETQPHTIADRVLIRQAMENLVANAIKYTDEGGSIMVRAHIEDHSYIFSVEDTGYGIPEEHIPYLFESFYRVKSENHKTKGSGLGLSLVKNVIVRHGGDVFVESEYDVGSRFGFYLPLRDELPD